MNRSLFLKFAVLTLLSAVAVTGCKKTPKNVTPIYGARTSVAGVGNPTDPTLPQTGTTTPPTRTPPNLEPGGGLPPTTPIRPETFNPPPSNPPTTFTPTTPEGGFRSADLGEFEGMLMDREALRSSTVYFDYDKSIVKATEVGKLQEAVKALKANPKLKLLVEGHCDERGTEEYNRALGERRALSVRAQLIKSGIAPTRVRTLSYGEDKPAELGHTEAAWAKNRRSELVLLKPKN
jgi:peptidoglycan-associated lipoprotein